MEYSVYIVYSHSCGRTNLARQGGSNVGLETCASQSGADPVLQVLAGICCDGLRGMEEGRNVRVKTDLRRTRQAVIGM
jgi:hypothetical protein